jgi:hypothetical protein
MLFTIKQLIDERKRIVEVLFASENGSDSQQPIMPIDEKLNNPNVAVSDLSEGEVKNFLERLDR